MKAMHQSRWFFLFCTSLLDELRLLGLFGKFCVCWQDGHLAYAVTWEQPGSASATRHAIADRAVAHALNRHLPEGTRVTGHAALLDDALAQKGTPPDAFAGTHRCTPLLPQAASALTHKS